MSKIKIYHFHNGGGGGVLSVIKNLLRFSTNPNIENHIIHAVNKKLYPEFKIEPIEGAVSQQLYFYSAKNNFYFTCKQLAKLLPNNEPIIVAHDWIELGMVSNLGLQNKVVYVLHGDFDYYYEMAKSNEKIIDSFVCISPRIYETLKNQLSNRVDDIFYLKFPVPYANKKSLLNQELHLIYYVRNLKEVRKQFSTILEIASKLANEKNNYFFTIAGGGMNEKQFFEKWPTSMKKFVNYLSTVTNKKIIEILPSQDIFLLPSESEGLPVSMVEAMKAGVVPMVTNWQGAVDELLVPNETGFYFEIGATNDYVNTIISLNENRDLLYRISVNAAKKANLLFDPIKCVENFENLYGDVSKKKSIPKIAFKAYGSRLDNLLFPNVITKFFRSFIMLIKTIFY